MLTPAQGITYNKFEAPNDWPKIDKTFDYKIENGKLLSGNEHIYLNGPVTYTIVGSPTIVDGIASGFTATQYVFTNSVLDTSQDFEIFTQVKSGGFVENFNTFFRNSYGTNPWPAGFSIGVSVGKQKLESYILDSNGSYVANGANGQTTFQTNTDYIIRFEQKGYTINLYSSSDYGETWVLENTWTSSAKIRNSGQGVSFGGGNHSATGHYLRGSIDLNNTYIKVNDHLWFYGKNYTTKNKVAVPAGLEYNNTTTPSIGWVNTNTDRVTGPVTYINVGSPTIIDGVVSGFSYNDYIYTSSRFSSSYTNYEMVIRAKPNAASYALLTQSSGTGTDLKLFFSDSFFSLMPAGHSEGRFDISGSFDTNIFYYLKYIRNGNNITLAYSTDGITWEGQVTAVVTTWNTSNASLRFGVNPNYGDTFKGEIDLNSTYITVNGQPWFGYCPSEFQQFTPAPKGTMIGKDDTHSLVVETYQDKGIVDYTVVGSPTIVDGIASGFSNNDYLSLPYVRQQQWEVSIAFLYIKSTDRYNTLYKSVYGDFGLYFRPNETHISVELGETNFFLDENYSFIENHNYQVVIDQYNTNEHHYYIKDLTTGMIVSQGSTRTFNRSLYGEIRIGTSSASYCTTSIDLNNTYIKVNGQYWFHPYPNSYPKLVGPVNYTTVGSPTITNGVASGFSASDYFHTDTVWSSSNTDWEIVIKAKPQGQNGLMSVGNGSYGKLKIFFSTTQLQLMPLNSLTEKLTIKGTFLSNTFYYVKATRKNETGTLSYSTDGVTWQGTVSSNTLEWDNANDYIRFGYIANWPVVFGGEIDLNETYVKINGALWFGKEDWTPSTYTDNAIYLLGSHSSDYSNYNTQGINPTIETESDEVGSYNVWIDNQKVIENKTGNTLIEWDKLALTTGYSIITPSALKAHPIKIEPTNNTDSIIAFNTETIEESDESI